MSETLYQETLAGAKHPNQGFMIWISFWEVQQLSVNDIGSIYVAWLLIIVNNLWFYQGALFLTWINFDPSLDK